MPRATLDRQARRQGERAQALRTQLDQQAAQAKTQMELTLQPLPDDHPNGHAWNIRERDHWGQSAARRRRGQEPERWHWVYTGTVFRLDHRGQTAGGKARHQRARFCGHAPRHRRLAPTTARRSLAQKALGQAAGALVIADGAAWIWRLADDRFPEARQRLDFYHAVQHLAAVGRALFGEDKEKYRNWLRPLVRQLKNQSAVKVIHQLQEALSRKCPPEIQRPKWWPKK